LDPEPLSASRSIKAGGTGKSGVTGRRRASGSLARNRRLRPRRAITDPLHPPREALAWVMRRATAGKVIDLNQSVERCGAVPACRGIGFT